MIRFAPSIGKPDEVKKHGQDCARLESQIDGGPPDPHDLAAFEQEFKALGQRRSSVYEKVIATRLSGYGRAFAACSEVKPDFIVGDYRPCAVTAARSRDEKAITEAIRRTCHVIEFTAHLQGDMEGLKDYLLAKVGRYALLLESV